MRRSLLVLSVVLACLPAFAEPTCDELVPKIMDASGLNQQLALIPEAMRQMAEAQLDREGSMQVDTKHALQNAMVQAFDVDRISRNVRTKLVASCQAAPYAAVLTDMQSPLAQKMLQMEVEPFSSPEATKRMQRYIASFPMQSPRESRMTLIHKLLDVTKEAELSTDEALQVTVTMTETAFHVSPSKDQLAQARAEMLSRIQEVLVARMYYIYRTASDEELQQYTAMQATPAAQRLDRDAAKALLYAFTQEATGLAVKLKTIVGDAKVAHGE
jgi:hypothetical protein